MSDPQDPAVQNKDASTAPSSSSAQSATTPNDAGEEGTSAAGGTAADSTARPEARCCSSTWRRFVAWLDDRTGILGLTHEMLYERIPGGSRWRYVWGSTLVFAFVVQVITGIVLWMHYSPSDTTAWESVHYINSQMQGGWLLRGIHHFMAQAMVVLLVLHMLQIVIDGAYKAPREVNFWLGLILMQIVLGLSLTGYLLPWDQKGYWATRVATNLMGLVPLVGEDVQQLVVGGSDYNHHTVTRFFALHAGVLPALLVIFVAAHLAVFRRHGLTAKLPLKRADQYFWPDQILKDGTASLAVMAAVLGLTLYFGGAELTAPADGAREYSAARPEWYFLFLFQFLKLFEGWGAAGEVAGAIVIPGLVMLYLFAMPLVARLRYGHTINMSVVAVLLVGAAALTGWAVFEDRNKPDYRNAVWVAHREAELADAKAAEGIPPEGMRARLRRDPQAIALQVLVNDCFKCHKYQSPTGEGYIVKDSTAPNLYGFGTARWAAGILNAQEIVSEHYFGNTPLAKGEMAGFMKDPERGGAIPAEEIAKLADALAAEADDERRSLGKDERLNLFAKHGCVECHTYNGEGGGLAPKLDGWGSTDWLIGMISNPAADGFYAHQGNDQLMPAFEPLLKKRLQSQPITEHVAAKDVIREIALWLKRAESR